MNSTEAISHCVSRRVRAISSLVRKTRPGQVNAGGIACRRMFSKSAARSLSA
jgi:hypothetical protein